MIGLRSGARTSGVALFVCLLLSGSPAAGDKPSRDAEARMMTVCLRAFTGCTGMDHSLWAQAFGRECVPQCADLNDSLEPLSAKALKACDFACSTAALKRALAVVPEQRWAVLVKECGRDHYGLPAGQEPLLSPKWFTMHRAGLRLAAVARSSTPEVRVAHVAMAQLWRKGQYQVFLPLPAYVPTLYDLPFAKEWKDAAVPIAFVVVSERTTSVAPWPTSAVLPDGARLVTVAPEPFPGKTVALRELRSSIDALRRPLLATEKAFGIRIGGAPLVRPTPAQEKKEDEELPKWMKASLAPRGPLTETLKRLGREAPFVLADASLPVGRLLEVVAALGDRGAMLAVKPSGNLISAERHRIALVDASQRPQGLRPINVRMTGGSYLIEGTKATSAKQAREVLARFKPKEGDRRDDQALVVTVVSGKVAQLVDLIDATPSTIDVAFLGSAR
jgi:hypothetical protein